MRLLYTTSNGRFQWTGDLIGENIPSYAILSHTWKEGQEVTFADLKDLDNAAGDEIRSKEGYQKLHFCAQQAKQDGLNYFWVDTCCIDKTNNTELSEAINSMLRWYQNAKKCYVFLSDVQNNALEGELAFRNSRWFNRGWTLQELLAPHSVEFFSKDGARLGDKESLRQTLHEITGIPIKALSGSGLSEFDVAERFSWAANRQTTREEDSAYCLLGIFDIHLPLIYGEGREKALKRLRKEIEVASEDVRGAEIRSRDQEKRLSKIRTWLSAPDPSTNYQKAHKQRQAETGLWLLHSTSFAQWKASAASRLWLYGIPGCGKTILSSTVIEHLLQHCESDASIVTAFFYFDFNNTQKQDPELMLRSLLRQLLQRLVIVPKCVDALLSVCENGKRQPSLHALLELIPEVMRQFTHVYIVLDALDECTQRQELMDILETVAAWQLDNVHLLMTSRKERNIESSLESYIKKEDTICLQRDVVDSDIQRYVRQRLSNDKTLAKWNKDAAVRQEIENALMQGAHGMFRWAVCQLDMLAQCRNRAMLRRSLATLPQTLDQTYDRILSNISDQDRDFATRILQWLIFSTRPMSVEEIAEVVAIDVARDPAFDRDEVLEDPLEALNICSSLVTITKNEARESTIALAHYSVQEYLVSKRIQQGQAKQYSMQEVKCHNTIAQGCLKYLMQFQQPISTHTLQTYALARYAAEFWSIHLQKAGDETDGASQVAMSLMSKEQPAYLSWIQLFDPDSPWDKPRPGRRPKYIAMPLYYAALLGLSTITGTLLAEGADVNAQGGWYGNALSAASSRGHEQVVKILLDAGANVNAQGGEYGNALSAASFRGDEQVVKILLDAGANVNAQGGAYGNALSAASSCGHEQVVKILLDAGANVNAQGGAYGNALSAASSCGHEQVVKILLDAGADVNAQGGWYGNALSAASYYGLEQVVKILLDAGADVNAQGGKYGNALSAASCSSHEQVVKILLDAGADVNAQGGEYGNALSAASFRGDEQVVKILLDAGANVNAQGGAYGNALSAASSRGHEQVVKILLDAGADVNAQGGAYGNALYAASYYGHEQVVKILLDVGADVNAQGGEYDNALSAASSRGHEQVVKMLLDKGANIQVPQGRYGNVLQLPAYMCKVTMLKLLLSKVDTTHLQDPYNRTLIWWAAAGGRTENIELLVTQFNHDPRVPDKFGRTPYWVATKKGQSAVLELLSEKYGITGPGEPVLPVDNDGDESNRTYCDVCTSHISARSLLYHCRYCVGGDWDVCQDCWERGARCADDAHTLVKRTRKNRKWVEVTDEAADD